MTKLSSCPTLNPVRARIQETARAQQLPIAYEHLGKDILSTIREETIGYGGMKIDRMLFDQFARHCPSEQCRQQGSRGRKLGTGR